MVAASVVGWSVAVIFFFAWLDVRRETRELEALSRRLDDLLAGRTELLVRRCRAAAVGSRN